MNAREAIRSRRAAVAGAAVVLSIVVGGFWRHPAWAIGFVLVIVVWLGSSAMPGAR